MKKRNAKETLELAEEHIKLAEDLVVEESKDSDDLKSEKLKKVEFELEKAEAELEEVE